MTGPVRPEPAGEPETVFEPAVSEEESAAADARRRGINLASHTGVGIAGAAGVLGVQRFGGADTAGEAGAADLDVFHEAEMTGDVDADRGVSASAEPVASDEQAPVSQPAARVAEAEQLIPAVNARMPEPVAFLPAAPEPAADLEPDVLVDFTVADEDVSEEHSAGDQPETPADTPGVAPRLSSLADAGTEIGGGVTLDDVEGVESLFGASAEFGVVDSEHPDDDDDDSLASIP